MMMMLTCYSRWWEFEDGRKGTPLLSREAWQSHLLACSFSGIEFASYEHDGPSAMSSVMVSTAIDSTNHGSDAESPSTVKILCGSQTRSTLSLSAALSSAVEAKGFPCSYIKWNGLATTSEDTSLYIVLDSADHPILANPSEALFENIKSLVTTSRDLIWVSYHESKDAKAVAMKALATGMARVLRRENGGVRFITLDVQDTVTEDASLVVDVVLKLAKDSLWPALKSSRPTEFEYALVGDRLKIPRIYTDSEFNQWAERLNGNGTHETRLFQDNERGLKLVVETPGLLSSLCFAHDESQSLPLGEDEIQLEAKAFGVNFRDVFIALGQMPHQTPMSGEVAGIVTAIGSGKFVQDTYKIGDRVTGILGQAYSSNTRINGLACHVLPDSIGFAEGVSLPAAYLTSYYCLVEIARLERGQRVLIHAASGGLGQSAIQLAQYIGAEVFVTAGSVEKRKMIENQYGIPKSHIYSSRGSARSMKRGIMQLTNRKGVSVVINSSSGEMLAESWECLGAFGYFFELGKTDIYKKARLSMAPFDRSLTFMAFDLAELMSLRPQKMFDLLGKILELVDQGALSPVWPLNIVPVDQIESGFRMMAERKHMGKIIIEANDGAMVKTIPTPLPPLRLDADGTYIIAGGLGDLGRKVCRLIASFGARHIVTLSRRSLDKAEQTELEDQVRQLGAELLIVQCDITDRERVHEVSDMCQNSLPPVKGIIHGAMVLKVGYRCQELASTGKLLMNFRITHS
jgi:NADPH:quinone reductase-like Zn-dependent oxidoreductase